MYLLSVWVSKQKPTLKYSYGFERMNVLAVFTTTILLVLFGINLLKHRLGNSAFLDCRQLLSTLLFLIQYGEDI